jgi:hypothetical protein
MIRTVRATRGVLSFFFPATTTFPSIPRTTFQITGNRGGWEIPDDLDNDGFVRNYQRRLEVAEADPALAGQIMGCRRPDAVPALTTLAREFAVCSRWFCSVPSATWPNRLFAHGAQSENLLDNVVKPYTHPTIFDRLTEAGRSWAVYAGDVPQALAYVELRDAFQDRFNRLAPIKPIAWAGPGTALLAGRGWSAASFVPLDPLVA